MTQVRPLGEQIKHWRRQRRLSQMDLALDAEISTRHLSFIETGRAQPSRAMVLLLAEQLEVPLRERNAMLLGAGYAPVYSERGSTTRSSPRRGARWSWCSRGTNRFRRLPSTGTGT